MPTSKRRKPKKRLPVNAMSRTEAAAHFKQLAHMDGTTFDVEARTVESAAPASTPFSNAWSYAHANGLDYAEGVVWRDDTGWVSHAWCVRVRAGVTYIVEVTDGFAAATKYKGWVLEPKDAHTINGGPDAPAPTSSVVESGLRRGGGNYTDLMGRLTRRSTDHS
jgi:hypothetical protein